MHPKSGLVRRDLAIRRARRILDQLDRRSPAKEESSTIVFFIDGKYLPKNTHLMENICHFCFKQP